MSTQDRIQPNYRRGARARLSAARLAVLMVLSTGVVQTAEAAPLPLKFGGPRATLLRTAPMRAVFDAREDLKAAYNKALGQYNNLELDQAKAGIEEALSGAAPDDPATAPLRMLKAVIIFSNTGKADETTAAFTDAVRADYNVSLPTELRSADLQKFLDKARKNSGLTQPSETVQHTTPEVADACGKDIIFTALARQVPEGGQVAFYWRQVGGGEFKTATMDTFGNLASVTLTASDHGDKPVEYFLYVFDSANKELGNKGDQEAPLKADLQCKKEEVKQEVEAPPPKPKNLLPRVFINIGLGTGVGVARGVADQSFKQISPANSYTTSDYACSLARWQAGSGDLPDQAGFTTAIAGLPADRYGGHSAAELSTAYDPDACNAHHPVSAGMAPALFHIAPEIGFRIGRAVVLSAFARIQVATGSKVYRDDPELDLNTSYNNEVRSGAPEGIRTKPGFTGAGGLKVKYFLGKDDKKFRWFVGGMIGGGVARLRVPMGFANDRNGNSVPDDKEVAGTAMPGAGCQPVWPYGNGCVPGAEGDVDRGLASSVVANADKSQRIDTVRLGTVFIGATFGFHYQIVKNFALFAEVQPTVWFPKATSFLLDFNLGPVITF